MQDKDTINIPKKQKLNCIKFMYIEIQYVLFYKNEIKDSDDNSARETDDPNKMEGDKQKNLINQQKNS